MEGNELFWAQRAWTALEEAGLTTYADPIQRCRVLVRLITLGTLYREFCFEAIEEWSEPDLWGWADLLNLSAVHMGQLLGQDMLLDDEDVNDHFRQALVELIDRSREEVLSALLRKFGDSSWLLVSLWLSSEPLHVQQDLDSHADGGLMQGDHVLSGSWELNRADSEAIKPSQVSPIPV